MTFHYSIIIPHRGPRELLQRCLDSMPRREDVEIVVVEDVEGRGAGWARNQGLKKAQGEYLVFADSDDYFLPNINDVLDRVLELRNGEDPDLVFFGATSDSWRSAHLGWIMAQEGEKREFLLRHTFNEPWCHVVKRALVEEHRIRFSETRILNDIMFTKQVGYFAKSVAVIEKKAYYIDNFSNSVAKRRSDGNLVTYSTVLAEANMFNKKHNIDSYYANALRPVFMCLFTGKWKVMQLCLQGIQKAGYSKWEICWQMMCYSWHAVGWMWRRHKYSKYR